MSNRILKPNKILETILTYPDSLEGLYLQREFINLAIRHSSEVVPSVKWAKSQIRQAPEIYGRYVLRRYLALEFAIQKEWFSNNSFFEKDSSSLMIDSVPESCLGNKGRVDKMLQKYGLEKYLTFEPTHYRYYTMGCYRVSPEFVISLVRRAENVDRPLNGLRLYYSSKEVSDSLHDVDAPTDKIPMGYWDGTPERITKSEYENVRKSLFTKLSLEHLI